MQKLTTTAAEMVAKARSEIREIETLELIGMLDDPNVVVVDIRDVRERQRVGFVPGSFHAPRGMIEFWFDPQSPYHREIYGDKDKTYVLFCNGDPRSALSAKALKDIGITNIAQLSGGMPAWREAGGPTVQKRRK